MALLDALALSRALEAHRTLPDALQAYVRMRYWHIRTFQWASAMFTPFYQSDGRVLAFARDWLAGPLSNLPIGRQVLVRLVSGMTVAPLAGARFAPAPTRHAGTRLDAPRAGIRGEPGGHGLTLLLARRHPSRQAAHHTAAGLNGNTDRAHRQHPAPRGN